MKSTTLLLLLFSLILLVSCSEKKKEFVPHPKYTENVYMKPDSTVGYIRWFGVTTSKKDTVYFYGVEYKDNNGVYHKRIIGDKDIFGKKIN